MVLNGMEHYVRWLRNNEYFMQEWKAACDDNQDPFKRAKAQEQVFTSFSSGLLWPFRGNNGDAFDNELDLKFGDFRSKKIFYDLKVGHEYTGAISRRSLENFGDTENNNHYYICVNDDFTRCVLINAHDLLMNVTDDMYRIAYDNADEPQYLGEIDYLNILDVFTF